MNFSRICFISFTNKLFYLIFTLLLVVVSIGLFKRLLLILWPYKFREFDWYRLDLSNLEKEYDVEVKIHEQVDFLFSHIIFSKFVLL